MLVIIKMQEAYPSLSISVSFFIFISPFLYYKCLTYQQEKQEEKTFFFVFFSCTFFIILLDSPGAKKLFELARNPSGSAGVLCVSRCTARVYDARGSRTAVSR